MSRMQTLLMLGALVLALATVRVLAEPKAAVPGATVIQVQGKVQAGVQGRAFKTARLGDLIVVGATIRTQPKAAVGLLFTDGSQVRLRENTELTLAEHSIEKGKRTTLLSMTRGFMRAVVDKLKAGDRFELKTPNAVAAVKGTDWGAGYDPETGQSEVQVFKTEHKGVLLTDLKGDLQRMIGEGQGGSLNGGGIQGRDLTDEERQQALEERQRMNQGQQNQGSGNGGQGEGGQGNGGQGSGGQGDGGQGEDGNGEEGGNGEGETGGLQELDNEGLVEAIGEALADELGALQDEGLLDTLLQDDAAAGLVYVDHYGYQVQTAWDMSFHSQNAGVRQEFVTAHFGGPLDGEHSMVQDVLFNKALPEDRWMSVIQQPLDAPNNLELLPTGFGVSNTSPGWYPQYYRLSEDHYYTSPAGDVLSIQTVFDAPSFYDNGQTATVGMLTNLQQGYCRDFKVNGDRKAKEFVSASTDFYNGIDQGTLDSSAMETLNKTTLGVDIFRVGNLTNHTGAIGDELTVTREHLGDKVVFNFNKVGVGRIFSLGYYNPEQALEGTVPVLNAIPDTADRPDWFRLAALSLGNLEVEVNADGFSMPVSLYFPQGTYSLSWPMVAEGNFGLLQPHISAIMR
jgi:hypothetical protein